MDLKLKSWKMGENEGVPTIQGEYAVMLNDKEVATQRFNEGYSTTPITFPRELTDKVRALTDEINKSIKDSF